jgi:hypothetical protein
MITYYFLNKTSGQKKLKKLTVSYIYERREYIVKSYLNVIFNQICSNSLQ